MNTLLANTILIFHLLFILFVVGGLPMIWVGAWLGVRFVRNIWFRITHLAAILFVIGESFLGISCPLTILEDRLRQLETNESFIKRWLHRIIFYDFPESILTMVYIIFALLVAATFILVPPNRHNSRI